MDISNLGNLFDDDKSKKGSNGNGSGTPVSSDDGKSTSGGDNTKQEAEQAESKAPAMSFNIDFGNTTNNSVPENSEVPKIDNNIAESNIGKENPVVSDSGGLSFNLEGGKKANNKQDEKGENSEKPVFPSNEIVEIAGSANSVDDNNLSKNAENVETEKQEETIEINNSVLDNSIPNPVSDNTLNNPDIEQIDQTNQESQSSTPDTIIAPEIPPLDQNDFEKKVDKPVDSYFDNNDKGKVASNRLQVTGDRLQVTSNKGQVESNTGNLPPSTGNVPPVTSNPVPANTLDNIQKVQVSKPHIKGLKKKRSINFKAFTIGCSAFLVLIAGVITGALYYFINNPDQINGIIGVDAIKSLLKIFSTIFFGFLFFAGFTIAVLNGYRLATIKDVPKGKFLGGLVFGLFILFGSLVGGVTILQHINDLTSEDQNRPTDLILMQIPSKQGMQYLNKMPDLPLIAPMQIRYSLNPDLINKVIAEQVGTNPITNIVLDCGNGKELPLGQDSLNFVGSCLYQHKGEYPMQLKFLYTDKATNAPKEKNLNSSIYFASELFLKTSDGPYRLSDDKTEIIMGKAPVKVFFDASKIFSDLKLGTYKLSRDTDANSEFDVFDDVEFAHTYTDPQLQAVYLNIPELGKFTYSLFFRVEQSDVPICTLTGDLVKDTTYLINADCTKKNGPIVGYNFFIYDANTDREIDTVSSNNPEIKYTFPNKGEYYVKLNFITDEGKKGRAESDIITVGDIEFKAKYNLKYRGANDDDRLLFDSASKHTFDKEKPEIVLKKLPLKLQLDVNFISPIIPGTEIFVSHMGKPILSNRKNENIFQINVQEDKKQYIDIRIYNAEVGAETKFRIPIFIEQTQIIGSLKASPDTVGETPFLVKLNASATKVTDEEDKIVYFSRDFDDGEKNKDTSQGIVEHVYTYNDLKESGEYHPKVTVKTSKGLSKVIELDKPIMVKKPRLKAMIMIDSHPGQIANKGDIVNFSIRTDGQPEKIIRDFGDGETVEMEGRAATEQEHTYSVPGEYKIKADIIYDNKTTSYPSIKLVVDE